METIGGSLPRYRASLARFEPAEWVAAGKAAAVGTFDWSHMGPVVANWNREHDNNANVDISQVPYGLVTVAWFWQCDHGHRWRETTAGIMATSGNWASPAPRWKIIGGSFGACRECVLQRHGRRYRECGHFDEDLSRVETPAKVVPGWCPMCSGGLMLAQPGDPVRIDDPPARTCREQDMFIAMASKQLRHVAAVEANAIVTPDGLVFPTLLLPRHRIAVQYHPDGCERLNLRVVGWEVVHVNPAPGPPSPNDVVGARTTAAAARQAVVAVHQILKHRDPPQ